MDTISIRKITKGNNSAKNVGGVTAVYLCTSSGMLYISTKFCEIISNGIKVIERTRFLDYYLERYQSYRADTISILKISKGNNSAKNVGE